MQTKPKDKLEQMAEAYATNEDNYFDFLRYTHFLAGAKAALELIRKKEAVEVFQQLYRHN